MMTAQIVAFFLPNTSPAIIGESSRSFWLILQYVEFLAFDLYGLIFLSLWTADE